MNVRETYASKFMAMAKEGFKLLDNPKEFDAMPDQAVAFLIAGSCCEMLASVFLCQASDRAAAMAGIEAVASDLKRNLNRVYDEIDQEKEAAEAE